MADPRIRVLPSELVNQIAAGEVVENPSSVVKELCENAVDAGAGRIDVAIEGGGLARVRVVDDGCGMTPEEIDLAVERHATSKLRGAEDLARIATMGFRGEALPSIAAVARVAITSRPPDAEAGWCLAIEGGAARGRGPAGCAPGTQVEVRDLFFNTPARRKFQRSAPAEAARVREAALRLALGHPGVHVRLASEGRTVFDLPPAASPEERARAALSRGAEAFTAEGEWRGTRVRAWLTAPRASQPTPRGLHLFVGRRPVRDRGLQYAVLRGFGELLPRGRWPAGTVWIDVRAGEVDVNVHPQKVEVRFARPDDVAAAVRHAIARAVGAAPWLRGGAAAARDLAAAAWDAGPVGAPGEALPAAAAETLWSYGERAAGAAGDPGTGTSAGMGAGADARTGAAAPGEPDAGAAGWFAALDYVGQLHGTYLVCQSQDELVIVDQHAAHERVAFERLRAAAGDRRVPVQGLIAPVVIDLPEDEAAAAAEAAEVIAAVGFELAPFGGRSFALRAVPAAIGGRDPEPIVRELLAELAGEAGEAAGSRALDKALATIACHSVVRAGDRVEPREARALLADMDRTPRRDHCPHGRPAVWRVPRAELERRFSRT